MTDPAPITAATGIIGTILAVGIGLAALIVTTTGRLSARLTAVAKEQARTSGLLVWNETVPRPSTAPAGGAAAPAAGVRMGFGLSMKQEGVSTTSSRGTGVW